MERLTDEMLARLKKLRTALPKCTYVVSARPPEDEDPSFAIWTLSHSDKNTGWSTDGGFSGYGLQKVRADAYAEAANALPLLIAEVERLRGQVKEYREALKPFARCGRLDERADFEDHEAFFSCAAGEDEAVLVYEDLRRAKSLLEKDE